MYQIKNISVRLAHHPDLAKAIAHKFSIEISDFKITKVTRRSIDSRKKNNVWLIYTVEAKFIGKVPQHADVQEIKPKKAKIIKLTEINEINPLIIGCGPSALFAGLALVENGFKPIFIEQGERIKQRDEKVNNLWLHNNLDEDSNVQFGEGGAGAYSDGKLTARNRDEFSSKVFDYLIKFGAEDKISYEALPHLGTDGIKYVTTHIIEYLEKKGCEFRWNHKLTDVKKVKGKLHLTINDIEIAPEIALLGIGNGARELFANMHENGVALEAKAFAIGFRIEHKQDFINKLFYGDKTDTNVTGPATYRLTAKAGEHGVYSFCMCPGGSVICASSETNKIVTNGMSFMNRAGQYGNSAIVATVEPKHFGEHPLAGIQLQREIEARCYNQFYNAPAQLGKDFLRNKVSAKLNPSSYRPGLYAGNFNELFPKYVVQALKTGLKHFNKRYKGFVDNGMLIGPETRTSSPVRIVRDHTTCESTNTKGLYPMGEGAGYAGGIISSAVDGFRVASRFRLKEQSQTIKEK
ncbi:MAG: hypothetical protein B6226_02370 [Candidatus Cloacimonetes bacterium 4572_65]|nr:MAG: hypothetical protein B6226_02370 [Candidatus Cloacimonetes bacterium 4572_65]